MPLMLPQTASLGQELVADILHPRRTSYPHPLASCVFLRSDPGKLQLLPCNDHVAFSIGASQGLLVGVNGGSVTENGYVIFMLHNPSAGQM